jgi:AcrR family transcriptional regulator
MDVSDKKQVNRRALLEAARHLVFEKGHDRISIQEITGRAGLATGTFYNYFESKQDVFLAVSEDMRRELSEELEEVRGKIKDPAMRVATTLKYYFYQAADNQEWREFTRCAGLGNLSLQQNERQCTEDIERGVKAGRFRVDDIHFTRTLVCGMVSHVNLSIRQGTVGRHSIEFAIRSILQMLGLPELVSKALTQTPLPPLRASTRKRDRQASAAVAHLSDYSELKKPQADSR